MAHFIQLERRDTLKYVDTYAHLDQWSYVGVVKVTAPVQVRAPGEQDISDGGVSRFAVRAPAHLRREDLSQALRSYFTRWGCAHEHDCCGCRSTLARVRRRGPRDYTVTLHHTFNY